MNFSQTPCCVVVELRSVAVHYIVAVYSCCVGSVGCYARSAQKCSCVCVCVCVCVCAFTEVFLCVCVCVCVCIH